MTGIKTVIHLVIAPSELPFEYENQVCAAIDVYENGERNTESYRLNYNDLTVSEKELWNAFIKMISTKEV